MFNPSGAGSECSRLPVQKPSAKDPGGKANGILKLPYLGNVKYRRTTPQGAAGPAKRVLAKQKSPELLRNGKCLAGALSNEITERSTGDVLHMSSSSSKLSFGDCSDARKRKAGEHLASINGEMRTSRGLMDRELQFAEDNCLLSLKSRKNNDLRDINILGGKENVDPGKDFRKNGSKGQQVFDELTSNVHGFAVGFGSGKPAQNAVGKHQWERPQKGSRATAVSNVQQLVASFSSGDALQAMLDGIQMGGLKLQSSNVDDKKLNAGQSSSIDSKPALETVLSSIKPCQWGSEPQRNENVSFSDVAITSSEQSFQSECSDEFSDVIQAIPKAVVPRNPTQRAAILGTAGLPEGVPEVSKMKALSMSLTVNDLSSSLSSLAIADTHCQEDLEAGSVSQKSKGAETHMIGKDHRPCEIKVKPSEVGSRTVPSQEEARYVMSLSGPMGNLAAPSPSLNSLGALVIENAKSNVKSCCPTLSTCSVATAEASCSMTVKSDAADLASSILTSQPFMGRNSQEPRKPSPSHDDGLKAYQGHGIGLACPQVNLPAPSAVDPLPENSMPMADGEKVSPEACSAADGGISKIASHSGVNNQPDKKRSNGGDATTQQKKRWENEHFFWVNDKRYQKLGKIGRGGSSEVYKVIASDCTIFALKRIKLKGRDYSSACGFYQEVEYLEKLRGMKYIIQLIDFEVTDKGLFLDEANRGHTVRDDIFIYMVLEYGEIDLAHMLADEWKERSRNGKQIDEDWLRFYWKQILKAVNTIHEERIVHSDLKPANFLLVKGVLKLIDFGIAKRIQSDTTNIERESQVGTLNYMSPEAFMMNEKDEYGQVVKCGRSSDIWSLGCILYQMVYGVTPFSHITNPWAKVKEITNPNHKIAFPPLSNPYLLDILKRCLGWKREYRLRIPQLLEHPFLHPHTLFLPVG